MSAYETPRVVRFWSNLECGDKM